MDQRFGSPDGGTLVIDGYVDPLAPPTFGGLAVLGDGSDVAVSIQPGVTLDDHAARARPDHITVVSIDEVSRAGHRMAVADLRMAGPFGPDRRVRWVGWEGETGTVVCSWDEVPAAEALRRVDRLDPTDGDGCPRVAAPFRHVENGLRCIFAPTPHGWLVVDRTWPDQADRRAPLGPGLAVRGGQLYRRTAPGETPSLCLVGPSTRASFVQPDGLRADAVGAVKGTSVTWREAA